MSKVLVVLILAAIPFSGYCEVVPYDKCFGDAGQRFGINKTLLIAIAKTESNLNASVVSGKNTNGSYDIGIMQINSWWLPTLKSYGISESDLRSGCTNIHVGAWILSGNISRKGSNWGAVGAYNAVTPHKQLSYIGKVRKNFKISEQLVSR